MKFENIKIDTGGLKKIEEEVYENRMSNQACFLIDYWKERMKGKIDNQLKSSKSLPYGYVGDGWPIKTSDQTFALENDRLGAKLGYDIIDWDTRDVGDAIYQTNVTSEILIKEGIQNPVIVDIGVGYGRLVPGFYSVWKDKMKYLGIDYTPLSILISSQFVKQMIPEEINYRTIPTWKISQIEKVNLFISIHSFQEMRIETVDFYIDFISSHCSDKCFFYSVNLWPEKYAKPTWELIFDRPFPINRDGSYFEKIWRIK